MSSYIRFDWAMKRLLRDKGNFAVLEGLITTLLGEEITIKTLLESESNQESEYDKYNRVDILGEDSKGRLILFEIQNNNEYAYFQRMLFGVSKLVTEYLNRGQGYESIRKVYSINIVYFSLGSGTDIVYHGKTEFRGIHNNELLRLSPFQQQTFKVSEVSNLYPEYYILRVNDFNRWSKIPLEQWIYFLNTGEIPEEANAPGLPEARERLKLDRLSKDELKAYYRHLDNVVILRDNILTERAEGRVEGHAEGRVEGLAEGRAEGRVEGRVEGRAEGRVEGRVEGRAEGEHVRSVEIARKMKIKGMSVSDISDMTGLDVEEIEQIDRF